MTLGFIKGIDGLRALAVLSVILYHLDPALLPGGFTGVDVFFVISGYVVAKSLNSRKGQPFSAFIIDFYKRRILRIYPALLACIVLTSIIVVLFIPKFYVSRTIEETALAAFFGVSNFILAFNTDSYFSPSAEFNPFIHTWSLGVEEQFYLIFPFLFYLWTKGTLKYSLHFLFLLSFAFCYYHTTTNGNHAYYLISSRFWELAAGAILFKAHLTGWRSPILLSTAHLTIIGLISILISLVFADKSHFPFPWAIFSVLGTCFLIHAIVNSHNESQKMLNIFKSSYAVHFGKLSYSLYLWHWPTYALFRWTVGLESLIEITFALVTTYVLSFISFYTLESKFPHFTFIKELSSKNILFGGLAIIFTCFFLSNKGFDSQPWRSLSNTANQDIWSPYTGMPTPELNLELSGRTLYVLGDSHAGAYEKMLAQLSKETGLEVKVYSKGGCGVSNLKTPVLVTENPCYKKITKWLKTITDEATNQDIIFLATLKMYRLANQASIHPSDPQTIIDLQFSSESKVNRKLALAETLTLLENLSSKTPMIVLDAPKPVFNYINFRCADWYTQSNPICSKGNNESRLFFENFKKPTFESLTIIKNRLSNVTIWDPTQILCTDETCSSYDGNLPLYFDGDHLSGHGNRLLYPSFKQHILNLVDQYTSSGGD
ncbi:acyltransferase family protein [Paraglaciecola sp. 2405UD69-4]|uniref:acyltransferase family protein n=1 Tax=Paraglaciecola sp. 2405UD69-4 TaxID=3391836 RepID=UPI0039C8D4A0